MGRTALIIVTYKLLDLYLSSSFSVAYKFQMGILSEDRRQDAFITFGFEMCI